MPGAGSFPAGAGPAGYDPTTYASGLPALPAGMPYLDLSVRQFTFAADGSQKTVHAVDQMVEVILNIQLGNFAPDPTLGTDWLKIKRAAYREAPKLALPVVTSALQPLIDRGDILLKSVLFLRPVPGRTIIPIEYVNLRLPVQTGVDPTRQTGRSF